MRSHGKRETIGILGGSGLLGSDLVRFLSEDYTVEAITRENYKKKKGIEYDVLINANGNSSRFWANNNPVEDFVASTLSVYQSIIDFHFKFYVYISSPDVYLNHSGPKHTKETQVIEPNKLQPYGFNKYLSELIVKKYTEKLLILRCAMVLGTKLKKGPFFDLRERKPLFVTPKSQLQLITTHAIAQILEKLFKKGISNDTINVGGLGSFAFDRLDSYFHGKIQISPKAERQIYEMNVTKIQRLYPDLRSSEQYLQEYLRIYS